MPSLRRRERQRRGFTWIDLTISDFMSLRSGWSPDNPQHNGPAFPTLESLEEFYWAHRDEIETLHTERDEAGWLRGRHPGEYQFVSWNFWLLPEEPRRRVDPDEPDETSDRMPRGTRCWIYDDGFECSFDYLARRELLEPGELDVIREKDRQCVDAMLRRVRALNPHVQRTPPWQYATIGRIWGEGILTDDELEQAAPYLD